jgi:hypothetical protein
VLAEKSEKAISYEVLSVSGRLPEGHPGVRLNGKPHVKWAVDQIGGNCIVATSGEIVASCTTKGDEPTPAVCDLDLCKSFKGTTFIFDVHRQPEAYRRIF